MTAFLVLAIIQSCQQDQPIKTDLNYVQLESVLVARSEYASVMNSLNSAQVALANTLSSLTPQKKDQIASFQKTFKTYRDFENFGVDSDKSLFSSIIQSQVTYDNAVAISVSGLMCVMNQRYIFSKTDFINILIQNSYKNESKSATNIGQRVEYAMSCDDVYRTIYWNVFVQCYNTPNTSIPDPCFQMSSTAATYAYAGCVLAKI